MGLLRFIYFIRKGMGFLNFILLLLALFGLMTFAFTITNIQNNPNHLTASDIADSIANSFTKNKEESIPLESLTEEQLQEGKIVEGRIFFNMGDFMENNTMENNRYVDYTHFAILLGDKVMSVSLDDMTNKGALHEQAMNYKIYLAQNNLSIWQYHEDNNDSKKKKKKKKEKKNQITVKQVIQENMNYEPGVDFKGKVVKMDAATQEALRNFLIPDREGSEPAFEIVPYELEYIKEVNVGEHIFTYMIVSLFGIVGLASLITFIWRIWHRKFFP